MPSSASAPTPTPAQAAPTIRYATEEDVPIILALIHELAAYENASDSVLATESSLLQTLTFHSNPTHGYAKTLLIFPPSSSSTSTTQPSSSNPTTPSTTSAPPTTSTSAAPSNPTLTSLDSATASHHCAGLALFFTNYSTWHAAPGIYLEDLFIRPEYRGRGYGKALLRRLAQETEAVGGKRLEWSVLKWNEPSLKFYKGIGAARMEEWVGMRVDGERLGELAGGGERRGR